jgi:Flp pilus assembly pilin Flp
MAGPIGQARGQAMIELMVMATLVLVLVSAGVALSGTIMKMFKHNSTVFQRRHSARRLS